MKTHRNWRLVGATVLFVALSACGSQRSYVFTPDSDSGSVIVGSSDPTNWQCGRVTLRIHGDNGTNDLLDMGHVCRDGKAPK